MSEEKMSELTRLVTEAVRLMNESIAQINKRLDKIEAKAFTWDTDSE